MLHGKDILVLSPHTDDVELGCGGTLARLAEDNSARLLYLAFSSAEESLGEALPRDTLVQESLLAAASLGIKKSDVSIKSYRVRRFAQFRQEILEELIRVRHRFQPGLVLTPSRCDMHQDHRVVTEEALRAFKHTSILGYELPWNEIDKQFMPQLYVSLSRRHLERKITALESYKSQAQRPYMDPGFTWGLAKLRGIQSGLRYAEAFEVMRWVMP